MCGGVTAMLPSQTWDLERVSSPSQSHHHQQRSAVGQLQVHVKCVFSNSEARNQWMKGRDVRNSTKAQRVQYQTCYLFLLIYSFIFFHRTMCFSRRTSVTCRWRRLQHVALYGNSYSFHVLTKIRCSHKEPKSKLLAIPVKLYCCSTSCSPTPVSQSRAKDRPTQPQNQITLSVRWVTDCKNPKEFGWDLLYSLCWHGDEQQCNINGGNNWNIFIATQHFSLVIQSS